MSDITLIGIFQCHENYGAHDWDGKGLCPQAWKAKGCEEIVITKLTTQEVCDMGANGIREMLHGCVGSFELNNNFLQRYYIDYELVHIDSELLNKVAKLAPKYMDHPYSWMDVSYDLKITEFAAKQAMAQLGLIEIDQTA